MARTSTKRRQQEARDRANENNMSFGDFSMNNVANPDLDTDGGVNEGGKKEPTVSELMAKIAEMNGRFEQIEQDRAIGMTLATQPVATQPVIPAEPKLDLTNLPDPVYNAKEFNEQLQARITANVAALVDHRVVVQNAATAGQRSQEQAATALWDNFRSNYSDYAENEDQVAFAAQKVAEELRQKGVDVPRYMSSRQDMFMKDVTKKMDSIFGKPNGEVDVDLDDNDGNKGNDDVQRTAGIFGGNNSPTPRSPSGKAAQGDMIAEIQEMQMKSGLF